MTLQELYKKTGGELDEVLRRLMSERLILKYVKKFPEDPHFSQLSQAVAQQDHETAYRAVHTLKGLCLSLGFLKLSKPVIALTTELREGNTGHLQAYFAEIAAAYEELLTWIAQLEG